jgi:hypothetical protein
MQDVAKAGAASNHRTQTIARAMVDCLAKLEAKERPTTDPDAEGSDGANPPSAPAPAPAAGPPPPAIQPPAN